MDFGRFTEDVIFCPNCGADQTQPPLLAPASQQVSIPPVIVQQQVHQQFSPAPQPPVSIPLKSGSLAAGLSLLWAGVGQIYVGRVARGIGIMALLYVAGFFTGFFFSMTRSLPVLLILGVILLVVYVWQIFDAHALANRYNEYAKMYGRPPW
jgi:TM2 domain-containing membrane protein YozV